MDGRLVSVVFFDLLGEKFARHFFAPHSRISGNY